MKAPTLTMEGGRLKRSLQLVPGRDFETVPEPVWRALYHWYGANLSLPRPVILESKLGQAELELFPRFVLFLRQQPATRSPQSNIWVNMGMTSLRMFPPYLPPGRGNVSRQQDQSTPSSKPAPPPNRPPHPDLILLSWTDPVQSVLWSGTGHGPTQGNDRH
ncbi:hypothetical protein INR49_008224 [Caranx melampygus]|nr:hypothetical protein INR49_008224 [Caranx melampygus]